MYKQLIRVTMDSKAEYSIEYSSIDMSFKDKLRFSQPTDFLETKSGECVILSKVESFRVLEGVDNE